MAALGYLMDSATILLNNASSLVGRFGVSQMCLIYFCRLHIGNMDGFISTFSTFLIIAASGCTV